jgi:hypothetical protein
MNARRLIGVAPLIVAVIPVVALARDCDEAKAEFDAKIKANGVTAHVLEVVDVPNVKVGKVVGSCGGGAKTIVYRKENPPQARKRTVEEKPSGT